MDCRPIAVFDSSLARFFNLERPGKCYRWIYIRNIFLRKERATSRKRPGFVYTHFNLKALSRVEKMSVGKCSLQDNFWKSGLRATQHSHPASCYVDKEVLQYQASSGTGYLGTGLGAQLRLVREQSSYRRNMLSCAMAFE